MSWSTGTPEPVDKDAIPHIEAPAVNEQTDGLAEAQTEQASRAYEAAALLAQQVGRPEDQVVVTMSGHANPGHAPRDGWSDETITVTVSARPR